MVHAECVCSTAQRPLRSGVSASTCYSRNEKLFHSRPSAQVISCFPGLQASPYFVFAVSFVGPIRSCFPSRFAHRGFVVGVTFSHVRTGPYTRCDSDSRQLYGRNACTLAVRILLSAGCPQKQTVTPLCIPCCEHSKGTLSVQCESTRTRGDSVGLCRACSFCTWVFDVFFRGGEQAFDEAVFLAGFVAGLHRGARIPTEEGRKDVRQPLLQLTRGPQTLVGDPESISVRCTQDLWA